MDKVVVDGRDRREPADDTEPVPNGNATASVPNGQRRLVATPWFRPAAAAGSATPHHEPTRTPSDTSTPNGIALPDAISDTTDAEVDAGAIEPRISDDEAPATADVDVDADDEPTSAHLTNGYAHPEWTGHADTDADADADAAEDTDTDTDSSSTSLLEDAEDGPVDDAFVAPAETDPMLVRGNDVGDDAPGSRVQAEHADAGVPRGPTFVDWTLATPPADETADTDADDGPADRMPHQADDDALARPNVLTRTAIADDHPDDGSDAQPGQLADPLPAPPTSPDESAPPANTAHRVATDAESTGAPADSAPAKTAAHDGAPSGAPTSTSDHGTAVLDGDSADRDTVAQFDRPSSPVPLVTTEPVAASPVAASPAQTRSRTLEMPTRGAAVSPTLSEVPPTLDVAQHFRELRRVLLPALLIALLGAGAVFAVRSTAPNRWQGTVTARAEGVATVPANSGDTSAAAALIDASYIAQVNDSGVLTDIAKAAGTSWDAAETQSRISVSEGQLAGLLQVQAQGDTPGQAAAVARQVVLVLDSSARARRVQSTDAQTARLQTATAALSSRLQGLPADAPERAALQLQYKAQADQIANLQNLGSSRLTALADPVLSDGPVSPKPLRDAALALVALLIVVAELLVGLRGRFGSAVSRTWAARLARKHSATFIDGVAAGSNDRGSTHVETLAMRQLREGRDVLVLACPPEGTQVLGGLDTSLRRGAGDGTLHHLPADAPWWRDPNVQTVGLGVVVVAARSRERSLTRAALRALTEAEIPAALVITKRQKRT